jgi:hypothetical protein
VPDVFLLFVISITPMLVLDASKRGDVSNRLELLPAEQLSFLGGKEKDNGPFSRNGFQI